MATKESSTENKSFFDVLSKLLQNNERNPLFLWVGLFNVVGFITVQFSC